MALTIEWQRRVDRWEGALWESCFRPLGEVALSGFTTFEQLTPQEAGLRTFTLMPVGTRWGAKWEYAWLKGEIVLPAEAAGERVILRTNQGIESLIWVNGSVIGSAGGWADRDNTLTRCASPGERFELLIEAYAGHGTIFEGRGPVRYGVQSVPEPGPTQVAINPAQYGTWREEVYQLALDFTTLKELRNGLDPLSLRVAEIDAALMDATLLADVELPEAEMLETVRAARERLKPLLRCVNGSTAPTLHAFGHAHLDVAWLWPWAETERKMARTVANQLALLEEYPDYRFLQSQAHLFYMLKNRYPPLYERFCAAVRSGNVIADGAMWVEADTNLAGGEALIRQVLYGQRFFRQELDVESRVLWLPDVFGYSGALPQILVGCGCTGFATAKITWAYNGGDPFPYNTFWWEGIDGSAIPAHIYTEYNSQTRPASLFERWNSRLQKNGIHSMLLPYGWGDGGGGPTRDHLEFLRRAHDLEGLPRLRPSSPAEFFADLAQHGLPKERYVGELYFQAHRGTYTSQAKTKQGNRRSEFALREAELWATAARALTGFAFTPASLEDPWRRLMLNQFHDILPGSSIGRVYEEAEAEFANIIHAAQATAREAAAAFTHPAQAVTVFNSLAWPRAALIQTPAGLQEVTVPACGWTTLDLSIHPQTNNAIGVTTTDHSLENEYLLAQFNERGEMVSLIDKETGRQWLAGPANRFLLFKDVPTWFDAWDVDSMLTQAPVTIDEPVTMAAISTNPLLGQIKLSRRLHHSSLEQVISLRRGSRRLDFTTRIDWQESHKLLKVAFPVNIHTNEAIHEIQFGHLRRPNHRSRPFDADRFEVCNHKWSALAEENRGVAVLNDCKYGLSVLGNSLNLTLLRSPLAPDMTADQGLQTFTYALYAWNGGLGESGVVQAAYDLNCPVLEISGAGGELSLFSLDAPNIVIETVKPAEDGSSAVVVRLYESMRMTTDCLLTTALPVKSAAQTDLLESPQSNLPCSSGRISLAFRPFEIKTIRLEL
jgi:alpha-mannosidase